MTASSGPEATELLGIAKELQDALGPSGFSFADLGADYAGIALAKHLLARPDRLADIAKGFRAEDYLPSLGDLEEGIPLQALSQKYGDPGSETFRAACRSVRDRIDGQGVYKTAADKKTPAAKE